MSGTPLQDFVCRALEHKRISFGDLRRLQRDILPDRITTREEAEILLALDRSVDSSRPQLERLSRQGCARFCHLGLAAGRAHRL